MSDKGRDAASPDPALRGPDGDAGRPAASAYELLFAQASAAAGPVPPSALGDPQAADYPARLVALFRSTHGAPADRPFPDLIEDAAAPAAAPESPVAAARALLGEDAADAAAEPGEVTAADAALRAAEEMLLALLEAGGDDTA